MHDDAVWAEFRVPHPAAGLRHLLQAVTAHELAPADVLIAVERPDGPFVAGLLGAGSTVSPINPKGMERYRDRFALGGTKTDRLDARCLAGLLRTDRAASRPWAAERPRTRERRLGTRDLAELEKPQTMLAHQLRAALLASCPAAGAAFRDLPAPSPLGFLQAFPTGDDARAAPDEAIWTVLQRHGYSSPGRKIPRRRAVLAAAPVPIDPAVVHANRLLITPLAETLLTLHRQIRAYDRRLNERVNAQPDREIFLSLRGAGWRRKLARTVGASGAPGRSPPMPGSRPARANPANPWASISAAPAVNPSARACPPSPSVACRGTTGPGRTTRPHANRGSPTPKRSGAWP
jgi:hypothetical protein